MSQGPITLLDALALSFAASLRSPDGVAAPAALLWTDADGQWWPLIPALLKTLPQLFVLGPYRPEERQGPVIWLRCVVERTLPEVSPPADAIPLLYLPNVSRQDLRAGGDCPQALQPLVELQYRGAVWHQRNGRDWTVEAFLGSEDGVGLDIAKDNRTRDSMLRALPLLGPEPLDRLRIHRLEADDFDRLAIGDPARDLLTWMSEPHAFEQRWDASRWATFRDICGREFGFDPDDGPQAAADGMVNGGGKWEEVWRRFRDAPRLYDIANLLREAKPRDLLADPSRRPGVNEEQEDRLRAELERVLSLPHAEACDRVVLLEKENGKRRDWVWAKLDQSPYAEALEPLSRLAEAAKTAPGGTLPEAMATDHSERGWRCDSAAIAAMASAKQSPQRRLVHQLVRALYEPWLDRSARQFQASMSACDPAKLVTSVNAERDTCILFADGLRFDVGAQLHGVLESRGYRSRLSHRIAPIPTVTATAKPVATPAYRDCSASSASEDFTPGIAPNGQPATASRLRDAMARMGVDVLDPDDARIAIGSDGGGWDEIGTLDTLGHSIGVLLAEHIGREVETIADRVAALLSAGWLRVRVVTDHGWLLLPGGLPRVDLPPALVETKWARCAMVRGESAPAIPTYPWYWNPLARIASPPGIAAFRASTEYAHGGVSLQECVVPELLVEQGEQPIAATITAVAWRGMRCRISVQSRATNLTADIRLNWKQSDTSIAASPKEISSTGEASLAVADDRHEGAAASIVVLDPSSRVLDHKSTTVGEDA